MRPFREILKQAFLELRLLLELSQKQTHAPSTPALPADPAFTHFPYVDTSKLETHTPTNRPPTELQKFLSRYGEETQDIGSLFQQFGHDGWLFSDERDFIVGIINEGRGKEVIVNLNNLNVVALDDEILNTLVRQHLGFEVAENIGQFPTENHNRTAGLLMDAGLNETATLAAHLDGFEGLSDDILDRLSDLRFTTQVDKYRESHIPLDRTNSAGIDPTTPTTRGSEPPIR